MFASINPSVIAAFGESVYLLQPGAEPVALTVVWDETDANMPPGIRATAFALESAFPSPPKQGDQISRNDVIYEVRGERIRDGIGGITLQLRQTK